MPLTTDDMKYYVDPLAVPYEDSKRIFVLEVRHERTHTMVGQIVNVTGVGEIEGHRMWFKTENGYYVYGAAVGSQSVSRYSQVVARVGDIFAFGEQTTAAKKFPNKRNLVSVRLSNGKQVPGGAYLPVTDWIPAAEWSYECMPSDGDSEEVIEAKLTLAKQKWDTKHAKLEIMRQGLRRGWTHDLKALQETGHLFRGLYGARVSGTALMNILPSAVNLDEGAEALFKNMKDSDIVTAKGNQSAYVGVPVRFYAPLDVRSIEEATSPSTDIMNAYLRNKPGFSHATMATLSATPVLSGIASS